MHVSFFAVEHTNTTASLLLLTCCMTAIMLHLLLLALLSIAHIHPSTRSGAQRVHIHRALLRDFFQSARAYLSPPHGEVHVTLKTRPPYSNWDVEQQAATANFALTGRYPFNFSAFPGYRHITTDPHANRFDADFVRTFVFRQRPTQERGDPAHKVNGHPAAHVRNAGVGHCTHQSPGCKRFAGFWSLVVASIDVHADVWPRRVDVSSVLVHTPPLPCCCCGSLWKGNAVTL